MTIKYESSDDSITIKCIMFKILQIYKILINLFLLFIYSQDELQMWIFSKNHRQERFGVFLIVRCSGPSLPPLPYQFLQSYACLRVYRGQTVKCLDR